MYRDRPWAVGSGSQELNGTYDMMGNIFEWTESPHDSGDYGTESFRTMRGGACDLGYQYGMSSSGRGSFLPDDERDDFGFRVASEVPEPATLALLTFGGLAIIRRRR